MCQTLEERGDPNSVYYAEIEVDLVQQQHQPQSRHQPQRKMSPNRDSEDETSISSSKRFRGKAKANTA